MVAIISVGAARTLALRPRGGGPTIRYEVGHGDLLVMAAAASARGSMRCRKRTGRSGPGSASSSDRPVCVDQAARPPSQFCHASVSVDGSRSSK
jgi:hypothetical protein